MDKAGGMVVSWTGKRPIQDQAVAIPVIIDCDPGTDDAECNFDCTAGSCVQTCKAGSTCKLTCAGGKCNMKCEAGATCEADCTGTNDCTCDGVKC